MAVNEFLGSATWVEHRSGQMPEEMEGAIKCYVKFDNGEIRCAPPQEVWWNEVVAYVKRTPDTPDADGWIKHDRTTARPNGILTECIEVVDYSGRTFTVVADDAMWNRVVRWRAAPLEQIVLGEPPAEDEHEALTFHTAGIGDVNSDAPGSGARYNAGKAPFELVPVALIAGSFGTHLPANRALALLGLWQEGGSQDKLMEVLRELGYDGWAECAHVFDYGRRKYAEWNWAKGMPWSVPFSCAVRHLMAMIAGESDDPESGLPHRGHVFCNIVMLWTYHRTFLVGDDRPAPHLLKGTTK